jgi:hypothetical protein
MEREIKGGSVHPAGKDGREVWDHDESLESGYRGRTSEDGDFHTLKNQLKVLAAEKERQAKHNAAMKRLMESS